MGFDGELESQPSTSNCNKQKLPTTLLLGCGAVNHASVPRKLRSAIKKRGREYSTTPPLSVSKKQRRLSNIVDTLKKEGGKKSRPKRGRITKDEEEVAETLYALAHMFSGSDKANQVGLNDEQTDAKSGVVVKAGRSMNAVRGSLLKSSVHVKKIEMSSSKQSSSPAGSSRVKSVSRLPPRLPAWLNSANLNPQTPITENCSNTEKCVGAVVQSEKKWKGSTAHVYIGRLIKVLQISERKEGSPEKPSQLTTPRGDHQTTIVNDILRHKRLIQDRQLASETSASCSAKEGYDFLSVGTKNGGLDTNGDVNRAGHSIGALKQFHALYMQPQSMIFSMPHTLHGHNSAITAQAQVPQYISNSTVNDSFMAAQMGRQLDLPGWKIKNTGSPSGVNNGQALFPHLLGYSNYQQLSYPHPMSVGSYVPLQNDKMNQHQFPQWLDRNGPGFLS